MKELQDFKIPEGNFLKPMKEYEEFRCLELVRSRGNGPEARPGIESPETGRCDPKPSRPKG